MFDMGKDDMNKPLLFLLEYRHIANCIRKAINLFFEYYRIDGKVDDYSKIQTFRNPLFLKIFCEAYSETYYPWRERSNIIDIYQRYIYKRNHSISADSDADPLMNYTERILEKLARYSLYKLQCGDIPREKASESAEME